MENQSVGLKIAEQRMKYDFKYYVENRLFIPYSRNRYIITDKHLDCIRAVMDNSFTLIQAYRSFGKSELITYSFALWRAEMWNESVLILSANENLAHMKLDLIRNAIESDNSDLRYMYSGDMGNFSWNRGEIHLIDKNRGNAVSTVNSKTGLPENVLTYKIKSKIFARSIFSISRGLHVDNILCDDIVVEQNSDNFDLLQKTKKIFMEAIIPIRLQRSRLVVVGTPQHDDDLLQTLKKNMLFKSIIIPAWNNKEELSCPELHTREFIIQQRILLGERSFQQEYLLRPTVEINTDFTWEVLNRSRDFDRKFDIYYEKKENEKIFIGTDFSIKESSVEAEQKDTDYFTMVALCYNTETKKRKILNMHRERGIKFSDQISSAIAWYYRYQADGLCTEKHGFLDIFNQITTQIAKDVVIIDTGTASGKFDKKDGIPSMKWEWEKDLWSVPCGDELSMEYANILFKELNQMDKSKHDDLADALFRAEKACIKFTNPEIMKYTPREQKVQNNLLNLGRVW